MASVKLLLYFVIILESFGNPMRTDEILVLREKVRSMFYHGYDSYMKYGYPYDELKPVSCAGHDTWGSYSLTLIDALDTLLVMGNETEFVRVAGLLVDTLDFDRDINVSVFETNIRVVGGLLSAHLLSVRAGFQLDARWPCEGPLLQLAVDVAERLLPAFDTATGMPYGTVNLIYGVPEGETPVTCTAGVGTFILEFGTLTKLTGDQRFEDAALKALNGLWKAKSDLGLVGNHVDVQTSKWTAEDSGIGPGVDSYYEYLLKGAILFDSPGLHGMFEELYGKIVKYNKIDDWYIWANMFKGKYSMATFHSLDAYWPGLQTLRGDIGNASKTLKRYHSVWKKFGFTPEFYQITAGLPIKDRESYPLRPELIESTMYLYQATKDPYFLEVGRDILHSIETSCRTECGYATVKNIITHELQDRMESFFLAETTKYLFLLFDTDNFLHGNARTLDHSLNCRTHSHGYVFNTEAHPIDIGASKCCHSQNKVHLMEEITLKPLTCQARGFNARFSFEGAFIED
ncbi:ER degradation-enhancing alpha-mannosidase-like protein 2 [Dendronephthya gigantea]|uniref:ER degradation-enhancing alpha-mannosidase-like protein 2 n=1 Tax=Dendronephthya gigantea TaxID=151771 RepID=UPI00106D3AB6|nr:ER degradation-enhancing alpha-mannosidase-like protein 2 [Dendronephthya gigantea]